MSFAWIQFINSRLALDIIPGFYKTYPNAAMQISLAVTAAPVVSISSSGVDLLAVGELDIQVLPSPNAPINALAFSIKTENIIKVRLIQPILHPGHSGPDPAFRRYTCRG